jgi:hypothetical protein
MYTIVGNPTKGTTMAKAKAPQPTRSNNEIRAIMLQYFYDRNSNATSDKGKKGAAVKISDVKAELKAQHELTQQQVQSNLTYLLSQGWVEEDAVKKEFTGARGTVIPSTTSFYRISAAGIDKIEGPGEFTMDKFHGIKIEATGQNIITVGDGNQVDAKYGNIGEALSQLRKVITESSIEEAEKLTYVADIDTIQSQLAKPAPNKNIIAAAWESVKAADAINGASDLVITIAGLLAPFLS